jgi:hypothetical protein
VPVRGDAGISDSGMPVEYAKGVKVMSMGEGEVVLVVSAPVFRYILWARKDTRKGDQGAQSHA